jgi:hypothetical protein
LTKSEWNACDQPFAMLCHLDGKVEDEAFMRFSVACCRRIWPLITDPRSRAVIEATDSYLTGSLSGEAVGRVCAKWEKAYRNGEIHDLVGGLINEAIESVFGVGHGHAAQVSMACFRSAGYGASERLREAGAPQADITKAWDVAQSMERLAQCHMLRELFGYLPAG